MNSLRAINLLFIEIELIWLRIKTVEIIIFGTVSSKVNIVYSLEKMYLK